MLNTLIKKVDIAMKLKRKEALKDDERDILKRDYSRNAVQIGK